MVTNLPALRSLTTEGLIHTGGTTNLVRIRSSGRETFGNIPISGQS